jgi:hypothetical protein
MTEKLRGILIDPHTKTVTEVFTDPYPAWKELIECDTITAVQFGINEDTGNRETIWLDDEGLLTQDPGPFFQVENYHQPLCGKGLILGTDQEGESVSSTVPLEFVQAVVSWPDVKFTGMTFHDREDEHPVLGHVHVHEQRAHFAPRVEAKNDPEGEDHTDGT